jgi:hypothetical protein
LNEFRCFGHKRSRCQAGLTILANNALSIVRALLRRDNSTQPPTTDDFQAASSWTASGASGCQRCAKGTAYLCCRVDSGPGRQERTPAEPGAQASGRSHVARCNESVPDPVRRLQRRRRGIIGADFTCP